MVNKEKTEVEERVAIEGKIAKIIDDITVVINRGYLHGVEDGMRFIIYQRGDEIFDPDNMESLGFFEHVKAKVAITNVSEKFSTARSDEIEVITIDPALYGGLSLDLFKTRTERVTKRLPLEKSVSTNIPVNVIKEGDFVREILK